MDPVAETAERGYSGSAAGTPGRVAGGFSENWAYVWQRGDKPLTAENAKHAAGTYKINHQGTKATKERRNHRLLGLKRKIPG